jgi:hypothetical protein
MALHIPFLTSPFPWVFLAALLLGAAAARATRGTRRKRDPERARHRKWVIFCVLLSGAAVLTLAAVFVPGPARIVDPALTYLAAGTAIVAFAALRFRKALGIPVLVLAVLLAAAVGLFLQSLRAFTGETEIGRVRVIEADGSRMKAELMPAQGEAEVFTLQDQYFAPVVKVIIFTDFSVFLGAKTWYRFEGLISNKYTGGDLANLEPEYRISRPPGISESLFALFEKADNRIPGVKSVQTEIVLKKARELGVYSIRVQNDGGVEVISVTD